MKMTLYKVNQGSCFYFFSLLLCKWF